MMMNRLLHIALLMVLVLVASACFHDDSMEVKEYVRVGDRLPQFVLTLNDGTTLTSEELSTHRSVIVFFNTTCSDCQRELPKLQQMYDNGEYVVAVSRNQSAGDIDRYWKENGFTMPYSAQNDDHIYRLFATQGIPIVYITNDVGIVVEMMTEKVF